MKALLDVVKALLKSKELLALVSKIALGLLDLLREQRAAQSDAARKNAGIELERKLEEARIKRLELEVELKRRELELQKSMLELEHRKLAVAHATSTAKIASAQKDVTSAERVRVELSERVDEVDQAVTVLRKVEEAADARDQDALERLTSALVVVPPRVA